MSPSTPLPPLPGTAYLHLSDNSLHFVRYEAGCKELYACASKRLQPHLSFAANLREMCREVREMNGITDGLHVVVTGGVTPVPLADFQEEDCEALYAQCFPERGKRRVFYEVAGTPGVVLLFSLEESICRTLEEQFGEVLYRSASTPLLRRFARKGGVHDERGRIIVHPHETGADVLCFDGQRLAAMNTFACTEPIDIAYYTLGLADHLSLAVRPESEDTANGDGPVRPGACTAVYVVGEEGLRDRVCDELQKYAADVIPLRPGSEYNRHAVAMTPGLPYDLITLLLET